MHRAIAVEVAEEERRHKSVGKPHDLRKVAVDAKRLRHRDQCQ
jgi:hypothetical protein